MKSIQLLLDITNLFAYGFYYGALSDRELVAVDFGLCEEKNI